MGSMESQLISMSAAITAMRNEQQLLLAALGQGQLNPTAIQQQIAAATDDAVTQTLAQLSEYDATAILERQDMLKLSLDIKNMVGDERYFFEFFKAPFTAADASLEVDILGTIAGDESVDCSDTSKLAVGETYVISDPDGSIEVVEVAEILTANRFRASGVLSETRAEVLGATLFRTNWTLTAGKATVGNGAYYSHAVDILLEDDGGRLLIRRDTKDGTLTPYVREIVGGVPQAWQACEFVESRTPIDAEDKVDLEYVIPEGGRIELRVDSSKGPSGESFDVDYMIAMTPFRAGRADEIRRPTITAPADGTTDVSSDTPTVSGDDYYSLYGVAQGGMEVEISQSLLFDVLDYEGEETSAATDHIVETGHLSTDTTYFVRIRYYDAEGVYSPWSEPVGFSTGSVFQYVAVPSVVQPAAGATGVALAPTITTSTFVPVGASDTHAATQYQIATDPAFGGGDIVYDSGDSSDLLEHTVPTSDALARETAHYLRVRHKGTSLGYSGWSSTRTFTTTNSADAPTITSPSDGATDISLSPTIMTSAFSFPGGGEAHVATQYQIATDGTFDGTVVYDSGDSSDLTSHVISPGTLDGLTEYHVRARHKGNTTGYSPWSASTSFTTVEANILGVAMLSTGGNGGTWAHVDAGGNTISNPGSGWFASHPVFGGIMDVTIDSQAMVKIPRFYIKRATISSGANAGKEAWWVSDQPAAGFEPHPAFKSAGVELDQIYVGKYQASSDGSKMKSVAGVLPAVSKSLTTFQAEAAARNTGGVTGFMLWSVYHWSAIQWLYLVEKATMDSQSATGAGRVSAGSAANVDASDVAEATYRGIVGLWGNVRQWIDGLKTGGGSIYLWDRNGNQSWINTGQFRTAGTGVIYPLTFMDQAGTNYAFADHFIGDTGQPSNSDATAPDEQYFDAAHSYVARVGGMWLNGPDAGLWRVSCDREASYSTSRNGARLAKE